MTWLEALPAKGRRGSLPRCLLLTEGSRAEVAQRLTELISAPEVAITEQDCWMPRGCPVQSNETWDTAPIQEAKLGEVEGLLSPAERSNVTRWWLAVTKRANTPNWDLASTCTVAGRRGILLVEAKAHAEELRKAEAGKGSSGDSANSAANHRRIGDAIASAKAGCERATGVPWGISRDTHYQMSNRCAWSWKLTELGYPVVLVYLGFLRAQEMQDISAPFASHAEWEALVKAHSRTLFPGTFWNNPFELNGQTFMPLIRSLEQPLTLMTRESHANRHQ